MFEHPPDFEARLFFLMQEYLYDYGLFIASLKICHVYRSLRSLQGGLNRPACHPTIESSFRLPDLIFVKHERSWWSTKSMPELKSNDSRGPFLMTASMKQVTVGLAIVAF